MQFHTLQSELTACHLNQSFISLTISELITAMNSDSNFETAHAFNCVLMVRMFKLVTILVNDHSNKKQSQEQHLIIG